MSNEIMNLIETVVIVPIIIVVSSFVITLIRQQTIKLQEKVRDEKIKKLLEKAEDIVSQAVISVSQTYVDSLKKDGVFDKEAQQIAFDKSKQIVNSLFTVDTMQAIQDNYGSIEKWIETKIEETVNQNK